MATLSNVLTVEEPAYELDISHIVTEDDEPVDNIFSAVQQRLLVEPLYSSWSGPGEGRTFFAESNIGVFYMLKAPPLVPDALLSLDVQADENVWAKEHRSYFIWEFGKPPDVVIEVVSNKIGGEDTKKLDTYARMRVSYYVIFDPEHHLSEETLCIYRLNGYSYQRHDTLQLPDLHIGLTMWEGVYSEMQALWLRWVDENGNLILTGKELAEQAQAEAAQAQAEAAQAQAEAAQAQAEKEAALQRAEKLAAMLRQLGQDPDQL
jgi:Uma2 family endonuclease